MLLARGESLLHKRLVVQRFAAIISIVCGVLIVFKLARMSVWHLTGISLLVRSTFWPSILLEAALAVCLLTSSWFWRAFMHVRSSWTRAQQFVLLTLCLNTVCAVNCLVHYPELLVNNYRSATLNLRPQLRKTRGHASVPIDSLAATCRKETPKNARILYHGAQEGWVFAYEVYPRRVYMLPSDGAQILAGWHLTRSLQNLWSDPPEKYWDRAIVMTAADREKFIREHEITHEVFYDAAHPARCRCEVLR